MSLGVDKTKCQTEFVEAMRERLENQETGLGANVDKPEVKDNLGALGQAVFKILTTHAETLSNSSTDNSFWQWVSAVNTWLGKLETWQKGVHQAFDDWAPTQAAEINLRAALIAVVQPGDAPAAPPTSMKGEVE